jgi:hypothetical protein
MRSLPVLAGEQRRRLPSASALERAFNCAGSEVLPHYGSTSTDSERGTSAHVFIARAREIGRDQALAERPNDDPYRALCEAIPLDRLPAGGSHEIALAWNYVTDRARVLAVNEARDYSDQRDTEYVGTFDYVGVDGDVGVLIDWKFGYRYLGTAQRSRQLRFGALAVARLKGLDSVRVAYFFLRDDGSYGVSWSRFDAIDLADIADDHRALAAQLKQADRNTLHQGDWCDYCPAFTSCPAKMQLAHEIGSSSALVDIEPRIEAMTDAELGAAYTKLLAFEDVAERVKKAIKQRAAVAEVDLGDGRVLGAVQWPYTIVNASIAYQAITELHDAKTAEEAAPRSVTLTAVKKLGKATLAEIERRGGVVTGSKPQVRIHQKKEND